MKNYYNSYGLRSFFTVGLMSLSVLIVASCAVNYSIQPYLYDKISVAMNGNQLFGNLSDYNLNNRNVRSGSAGGSQYSVTLESLLDRSRTETMTLKKSQEQFQLRQIPFISNSAYQYAYLQDSNATRQVHCPDSMYVVKQFLVELKNETRHYDETFVVAMISAPDFVNKYSSHTELSWLERANFTGLSIVYSLNGDFSSVNYLENGRVISAKLRKPGEPDDDRRCHYLMIPSIRKTRAGEITEEEDCWYDEIEASYCIVETGGREDSFVNRNREGEWESDRDRERDGHSGGGGSGGSDNSGGGPGASENQLFYIVDLTSDINCSVTGSGIYAQGSLAICSCYPNSALYAFDRWVGDLSGKEWSCLLIVNDNIVSTAYSKYAGTARNRPCVDTTTGLANPLMSMSVAASGGWNIKGGTFGFTRVDKKKNKKFHSGIDLAAEPGTPIYSMYDGVVSSSHYVVEQPDRVKNKYPDGYSGDKNDAGNRIFIASEIGEETVYLGYWHLQSGTPVAINPRTGVPFAPGDQVYQGEVIAYTGITGNATPDKAPESHLHLAAKVGSMNSSYVDPSPYINGTINTTQREITHIICN